ncbi:uncharacterized protein LOC129287481 [Prosopis cineraria]|uniref:uncharacterized protein LOC129287481 n=1 Tax=Prosopis cineraria TaxID=364024 RepID=UPI00240FB409|nr:uncharacterized protein LOC129287481 [Prosopis cineraria]
MCAEAIIFDFTAINRGRKLTIGDFWSELNPFSNLLVFDTNVESVKRQTPWKLRQVPISKGAGEKKEKKSRREERWTKSTQERVQRNKAEAAGQVGRKDKEPSC